MKFCTADPPSLTILPLDIAITTCVGNASTIAKVKLKASAPMFGITNVCTLLGAPVGVLVRLRQLLPNPVQILSNIIIQPGTERGGVSC